MPRDPLHRHSARIEVTAFVCPKCGTIGRDSEPCGHYVGGSAGWLWHTREPVRFAVQPVDEPAEHIEDDDDYPERRYGN